MRTTPISAQLNNLKNTQKAQVVIQRAKVPAAIQTKKTTSFKPPLDYSKKVNRMAKKDQVKNQCNGVVSSSQGISDDDELTIIDVDASMIEMKRPVPITRVYKTDHISKDRNVAEMMEKIEEPDVLVECSDNDGNIDINVPMASITIKAFYIFLDEKGKGNLEWNIILSEKEIRLEHGNYLDTSIPKHEMAQALKVNFYIGNCFTN